VDKILSMPDRKIAPNGSRCSVFSIRGSHETPHDLPSVLGTFHDSQQGGPLRYELDQLVVIGLSLVFGVVALGRFEVNRAHVGRHEAQLLMFQPTKYFADETALDAVGLHDEKRSIHDEAI
jgi:hypothetical protein